MEEDKKHYLTYIRWMISDPEDRFPKTLPEFREAYNLSNEDIKQFELSPTYYEDFESETRKWGISKLPEVMRGAYKQAASGNAASVRAFKEMLEDTRQKNNNINIFAINPTPDQYQRILNRETIRLNGSG